jgi:hypothetical protein
MLACYRNSTIVDYGFYSALSENQLSGEKSRMPQQGIAATVVEDLTGLKKLIADEHVGECGNIFGSRKASQGSQLDKAAFECFRIRSKVAHTLT